MKEPNDRQKALAKYMAEHVGISMSQAMRDLGYSESYAHTAQIKKTGSWQRLMKKYLPDKKLVKVIKEGLEATKVVSAQVIVKKNEPTSQANGELPPADSRTNDFIDVPDYMARHKFVETALKIKGKLVERVDATTNGKDLTPLLVEFIDKQDDNQPNNEDTS